MRSNLRNLCCTAIGQASGFGLVSKDVKDVTQEELVAIKSTTKLLQKTLVEMMEEIIKSEPKEVPEAKKFKEIEDGK